MPFGRKWFEQTPAGLRRLALAMYGVLGPIFVASLVFLGPGLNDLRPYYAVMALLLVGGLWLFVRRPPKSADWVFAVVIVPTVCCGIAYTASGARGQAYLVVMGAPLAWSAAFLGLEVVIAALGAAIVTVVVILAPQIGLGTAMLSTLLLAPVAALVGWLVFTSATLLREARLRLQEVLEASTHGFWDRDLVTGRVVHSARMNEIVGRPALDTVVASDDWLARIHPDDAPAIRPLYEAVLAGKQDRLDVEVRSRRPDGSWIWVRSRGQVVERDGAGRPLRFLGTITDISERKRAEQVAKERADLLRNIAAYVPGILYQYVHVPDGTGRFLYVGPRCQEVLELDDQSVLADQTLLWGLLHPDDLKRVLEEDAAANREGREFHAECRIVTPSGKTKWISLTSRPAPASPGEPPVWNGIVLDITERKQAEAELVRSEEQFRQMFNSLPIPAALTNHRSEIVAINDCYTDVLGYVLDDVPDVQTWFRKAYPDEGYRGWAVRAWEGSLRWMPGGGGAYMPGEYRVTCKDGTKRTMMISGAPVGDTLLVALVDVTRNRELQDQLQVASRLAAMGTMVAGVAHEINNPLAGALASQGLAIDDVREVLGVLRRSESLDRDALTRQLEDVLDALGDAQTGDQRIARIVQDLTTLGRPDTRRTRVRLLDMVDEAMRWLPAATSTEATVIIESGGAPDVDASAGQLGQVLVNLVTNAAKSIPDGRKAVITIKLGPGSPGMARFEVTDNGSGISPDVMARMFDPFFTTREVGQGMGLGLPVCHAIVTAHGGSITATSEVGKGSTFRVELPAVVEEE